MGSITGETGNGVTTACEYDAPGQLVRINDSGNIRDVSGD
ncbi:MAG: hypothetical protein II875_05095 [Clostridia bacterium]|nr:hypothetical protein [Clostridia bacterium]